MARETRVMHNHITQITDPQDVGLDLAETIAAGGEPCPACQLIRPEVMTKIGLRMVMQGVYMGEVPTP